MKQPLLSERFAGNKMTISEVMHVHIPTLNMESTFRDAVDKMDIYQFPALVIVDQKGQPVSVVTEGDLARAVSSKGDVTGLAELRIDNFATKNPQTADANMEIGDALHLMLSNGISILPIVRDGLLAGIALRVDLMQAMLMDVASPLVEHS